MQFPHIFGYQYTVKILFFKQIIAVGFTRQYYKYGL